MELQNKHVLITGASTGIGRSCALYLVQQGFTVYAGVRLKKDGDSLAKEAGKRLIPVLLDVIKPDTLKKTLKIVQKNSANFYAVVNNAGISYGGPLEIMPMEDFRKTMDVNVFGVIQVLKTFLPLIRENKGRIINIGSVSGIFSTPSTSAYCASKFALEALTSALRFELYPFQVPVCMIAPGAIDTPIWNKGIKMWLKSSENIEPGLQKSYRKLIDFSVRFTQSRKLNPPEKVAMTVYKALTVRKPKFRYLVGTDARLLPVLLKFPQRWIFFLFTKLIY